MTIQVCLGGIDAWVIQQPQVAISFLEATFGKKMEIPDDDVELGSHKCRCCIAHSFCEPCLKCGVAYGHHNDIYRRRECAFHCRVYQVLKQCRVKGTYETTFDITNVNEQTRLKKFIEFISMK